MNNTYIVRIDLIQSFENGFERVARSYEADKLDEARKERDFQNSLRGLQYNPSAGRPTDGWAWQRDAWYLDVIEDYYD